MAECIKQLKTLNGSSFSSPVYFGAEQRFIGAIRGANVDNLEEQYILGVDGVTTEEWDSTANTHTITKEFYDGTQSNSKYYKLIIVEYLNNIVSSNITSGTMLVSDDENVNKTSDVTIRTEKLYYGDTFIAEKTVKQKRVNGKVITTEKIQRQ
jgi:hypothetical protein